MKRNLKRNLFSQTRAAALLASLFAVGLLSACANLSPDYQRPAMPVPVSVDGQSGPTAQGPSFAEFEWRNMVRDDRLQKTIELALGNNRDLRIAVLNIEKARAQTQIDEAARYPSLSASLSQTASGAAGLALRCCSVGTRGLQPDAVTRPRTTRTTAPMRRAA